MLQNIQMVDLKSQYQKIKEEIDLAVIECIESTAFINGPSVKQFQQSLEAYLGVGHVITCGNGTDSLQIAMMALGLEKGDEVICPGFTYVATAEVIALLGLVPVMIDVDSDTFNMDPDLIKKSITPKTKAIVPVHLYGQSCDMHTIMQIANEYCLYVIEDNAQAIGAEYTFPDGSKAKTGTMGHIGSTSFFPSKNLGCYGDGGALMTNDVDLANKMRMIANHGQEKKYYHKVVGCNSRLDTIQAAVLNVKLKYLDQYSAARNAMADYYDQALQNISGVTIPYREKNSTHVFHQYTLKVENNRRNNLQKSLLGKGIPSMIYYPLPLYQQEAFSNYVTNDFILPVTAHLCETVISLPMHTEMNLDEIAIICEAVKESLN